MNISDRLMQIYFNHVYNPVYDFTTGQFDRYRKLQERCISKLELQDDDEILCVGVGTGNELDRILKVNNNVSIVGVDYSATALRKAHKKASEFGKQLQLLLIDVRNLEFGAESFDKVVCIHVMDFVAENYEVTNEILRVLKNGGQFVITYPSEKESLRLGSNLLKERIRNAMNPNIHPIRAFLGLVAQIAVGLVYLPLLARPNKIT